MMTKKKIISILLCLTVSACALPIPPNKSRESIIAQSELPVDGKTTLTLADAKRLVDGWRVEYENAARGRRYWELGFGEALFYGSILAVLGVANHHDRVRNVGAGLAGGASLMSGHYKMSEQATAFRKAIARLTCIDEALTQITPADGEVFELTDDQTTRLTELPTLVLRAVNRIRRELGDTLNSISLSVASREEIGEAFAKWRQAKDNTPKAAISSTEKNRKGMVGLSASSSDEALRLRKQTFLNALMSARDGIDLCVKEPK